MVEWILLVLCGWAIVGLMILAFMGYDTGPTPNVYQVAFTLFICGPFVWAFIAFLLVLFGPLFSICWVYDKLGKIGKEK